MKKTLVLIFAAILLFSLVLAGCTDGDPKSDSPQPTLPEIDRPGSGVTADPAAETDAQSETAGLPAENAETGTGSTGPAQIAPTPSGAAQTDPTAAPSGENRPATEPAPAPTGTDPTPPAPTEPAPTQPAPTYEEDSDEDLNVTPTIELEDSMEDLDDGTASDDPTGDDSEEDLEAVDNYEVVVSGEIVIGGG